MHIQQDDEKNWGAFTLDVAQVSALSRYLKRLEEVGCRREPMLGFNGLDGLSETWRPYSAHDEQSVSARIEHGLRALRSSSQNVVKLHNQLMDDLHLAFMQSLTTLSGDIQTRNANREKPFRSCDPALLESSVSI